MTGSSLKDFYIARFSDHVELGPCVVGRNLNLYTLRGFARLDELAAISAPDIYDQELNPFGTQRDLNKPHAREAFSYAVAAAEAPADVSPRFFPEVLLNARDKNAIEIYDLDDNSLLDFDSRDGAEYEDRLVGVRVRLGALQIPSENRQPQVSRVDGNHRLYGAEEALQKAYVSGEDPDIDEFPSLSFSLLVGLEPGQEAQLFKDINAEQKGMNTAHLSQLTYRLEDDEAMKTDERLLPLWLAYELTRPGRAFHGKVFMGGSAKGAKERFGEVPPIRLNALRSTVATQLSAAQSTYSILKGQAEALLAIIDAYWKAVAAVFPEAWHDRSKYILLQAIGLGGFARFGGTVMDRAINEKKPINEHTFESYLRAVAQLDLSRDEWPGIAGAGGARVVSERLHSLATEEAITAAEIIAQLEGQKTLGDAIDEVAGGEELS